MRGEALNWITDRICQRKTDDAVFLRFGGWGVKKRIIICADGTWNRPEKNLNKDFPTNVLKLARAIQPIGDDQVPQQVWLAAVG